MIIIWSSTPVPIAAKIPAIVAKSIFQCIIEAVPNIRRSSARVVNIMGNTKIGVLYLRYTTNETINIANTPAINAPFSN